MVAAISSHFSLIGFTISEIMCDFQILAFWFETTIHAYFLEGELRYISQKDVTCRPTPKRHLPTRKHVWATTHENRFNGTTSNARDREKRTGQKKSQRCYISPSLGEASAQPNCTKICRVVTTPDIITCAKFWTGIFRGYDSTCGRISDLRAMLARY